MRTSAVASALLFLLVGCDNRPAKEGAPDAVKQTGAEKTTGGTSGPKNANASGQRATDAKTAEHESHDHHHHDTTAAGPHGGCMIEVGEHVAHAELIYDAAAGTVTIYLMDCDHRGLRSDLPAVQAEFRAADGLIRVALSAVANELTGEKAGDSSVFSGTDDRLKGLGTLAGKFGALRIKGVELADISFECSGAAAKD